METVHIQAEPEPGDDPEVLQNQDPAFLVSTFLAGKAFFEDYGWFILFGFLLLMLLYSWLQPHFARWLHKREEQAYYSKYGGEKFQDTYEAMQRARQRMQAETDRKTEIFMEQEKEREEKKRQQRLEKLEGKSSKLTLGAEANETSETKPKPKSKSKRLLSSDYNPMAGGSGGSSFRPSRRFTGGG